MRNALRKGVLVVKAAGNSGEDGPFTADVFTAVGSIATASVGDDFMGLPLDSSLVASGFSSYGPVSGFAQSVLTVQGAVLMSMCTADVT
jgi:hypothetical protein